MTSSVSANVWYLVCGAILNSMIVSFLLKVAHRAIHERLDRQADEQNMLVVLDRTQDKQKLPSRDLVSMLLDLKWLGGILFEKPNATTTHDYYITSRTLLVVVVTTRKKGNHNRRKSQGSDSFWEEWREVCSVT